MNKINHESGYQSLTHTRWKCKYHVVFIPKYRKRKLFGVVKKSLGQVFHDLAGHKECVIEEGHIMPDHVHMMISVPPKISVSKVVGYIKGKSAMYIAREFCKKKQNFGGYSFWARGYFVTTTGNDEEAVREYIRNQENTDRRLDDQQDLFD